MFSRVSRENTTIVKKLDNYYHYVVLVFLMPVLTYVRIMFLIIVRRIRQTVTYFAIVFLNRSTLTCVWNCIKSKGIGVPALPMNSRETCDVIEYVYHLCLQARFSITS